MKRALSVAAALVFACGSAAFAAEGAPAFKGRGYALVVGIDETPGMGKLSLCRAESRLIARALRASGFESVVLLTDDAPAWEQRATWANIRSQLRQIADLAAPGDRVFVYLTGMGIAPDAAPAFLPCDGDGETGIPLAEICTMLGTSRAAAKLIALDVCRVPEKTVPPGAGFNEMLDQVGASGCVILSAKGPNQSSRVDKSSGRTLFTRALLDALAGKADADDSGIISIAELCEAVAGDVKSSAQRMDVAQTVRVLPRVNYVTLACPTDAGWLKRLPPDPLAVTPEARAEALRNALAPGAPKEAVRAAIRLAPGDFRAAEAALDKGQPIGAILRGKVRFVMHRKMIVTTATGTTKLYWKFNDQPVNLSFEFSGDTHECIGTAELPAGEYSVGEDKWEHMTNMGTFSDGPYKPVAATLLVMPGGEHEFLMFDQQTGGPHGQGTIFYDGRRICRTDSLQKKSLTDAEIDKEDAKGAPGAQAQSLIVTAAGQRQGKLYAGALNYAKQALAKACEISNRAVEAEALREMAFLCAVAKDDSVRSARKAIALAEQANRLASELKLDNGWAHKDALAAALAENGRFEDAAEVAVQAAGEARALKPYPPPPHILDALDARTKSYQARQPWRE